MREANTELESCVLSIVRHREPCTAYAVRMILAASASSFWSGSSGAVYPLLRRLQARGLLEVVNQPWGEGSKKLFRLTRAGRAELKHWVRSLPEWSGAVTMDPIRTRVFALDALTPRERELFFDRSEELTLESIARLKEEIAASRDAGDRWEAIGTTGALRELEARLRWLVEARLEQRSS